MTEIFKSCESDDSKFAEANAAFIEVLNTPIQDPFYKMIHKIDRKFVAEDVVIVGMVCRESNSQQENTFQQQMNWYK